MDRLCRYGSGGEGEKGIERQLCGRVYYVRGAVIDPLDMRRFAVCEVIACERANVVGVEIVQPANVDLLVLELERRVFIIDFGYDRLCTRSYREFRLFSFLEAG